MKTRLTFLFLLLVAAAQGGCFGRQEIQFEKRKIVYAHGGLLSFGVLVVQDLEVETKSPPPPAMGAGTLGN